MDRPRAFHTKGVVSQKYCAESGRHDTNSDSDRDRDSHRTLRARRCIGRAGVGTDAAAAACATGRSAPRCRADHAARHVRHRRGARGRVVRVRRQPGGVAPADRPRAPGAHGSPGGRGSSPGCPPVSPARRAASARPAASDQLPVTVEVDPITQGQLCGNSVGVLADDNEASCGSEQSASTGQSSGRLIGVFPVTQLNVCGNSVGVLNHDASASCDGRQDATAGGGEPRFWAFVVQVAPVTQADVCGNAIGVGLRRSDGDVQPGQRGEHELAGAVPRLPDRHRAADRGDRLRQRGERARRRHRGGVRHRTLVRRADRATASACSASRR